MKPFGFDLLRFGHSNSSYDSSLLHRHTFYELFIFTRGSGSHEIDFDTFKIEKNSVHFVSPGQIHRLALKNASGFVLCFSEEFLSVSSNALVAERYPFFENSKSPALTVPQRLISEMSAEITALSQQLINDNELNSELSLAVLNLILVKIKRCYLSQQNPNKRTEVTSRILLFKKLLNEKFAEHLAVAGYASLLKVSPNHLNALCKIHEGKNASQLIQERLILEAKRLLYATDLSVKEITYKLNFTDYPYFVRFFKKQCRVTPLEYRETLAKNR